MFYHIRDIVPYDTAIQIYYSFVHSRLSYAIELYGTAKASTLKPLQTMQNRLLKVLLKKNIRHSTNQLYNDNNILMLKDMHHFSMGKIIFKHCNQLLPPVLSRVITPSRVNHPGVRTRNNSMFFTSHHNTHHGKLLLNNYCCNIWQGLPASVKNARSCHGFKTKLKSHLLSY